MICCSVSREKVQATEIVVPVEKIGRLRFVSSGEICVSQQEHVLTSLSVQERSIAALISMCHLSVCQRVLDIYNGACRSMLTSSCVKRGETKCLIDS